MKTWIYTKRNFKELISDPLSLVFIIGLPVFLLIFMVSLNQNMNFNEAFKVHNFVPSVIIFSYAFLAMFSGMLISKDRHSAFLSRMFISPLKSHHYILGYIYPFLGIALIQTSMLYIIGFMLGLQFSVHILVSIPLLMLIALLFIAFGLLCGSMLKEQQVGPIVSILIQVVAFLSGMWFSLDLVGGVFKHIGYALPFAHGVDLIRAVIIGQYQDILIPLLMVSGYVSLTILCAVLQFKKQMKS